MDSDRLMPKRVGSASASSTPFKARARARSTSTGAIGLLATPSRVAIAASRAVSIDSPSGTCTLNIMKPGSKSSGVQPPTPLALRVSTSALYRRPAGSIVMMETSASSAAWSGCAPGTVWYAMPTSCWSPTRRIVTRRSPSCTGSVVYSRGSARVGLGMAPKYFAIQESVWSTSNAPAITTTALSGW